MAGDDLIASYLNELAWRLRWRVDSAVVIDELRDHLLSACAADNAIGRAHGEVQRDAIDQMGPIDVVASALLSAPGVRLAIPTRFTRVGGVAALVAGAAWPLLVVAWLASVVEERRAHRFDGAPQWLYVAGAVSLCVATAATVIAVAALCRRYGAARWNRRVAVACASLAAATSLLSWLVVAWAGLLGAAGVAVLLSSRDLRESTRWGLSAFAAAWPVAAVTWIALRSVGLGWRDEWGSYPLAVGGAVAVGATLAAVGCVAFGRPLAGEDPVTEIGAAASHPASAP